MDSLHTIQITPLNCFNKRREQETQHLDHGRYSTTTKYWNLHYMLHVTRISRYQAHVTQACFCHILFVSVIGGVDVDQVWLVSAVQLCQVCATSENTLIKICNDSYKSHKNTRRCNIWHSETARTWQVYRD
jgi:hypothetical protein